MDYESSLKTTFNTILSQRKIQIPQNSHGCKIQPGCIPNEDGSNPGKGLKGVIAIHDDITIFSEDDDDHDKNLITLIERAKQDWT